MNRTGKKNGFTPLENYRDFAQPYVKTVRASDSLTGFTLIEIAAVFVIIGLITVTMIGFTVYITSMKREKLNTGCRKVRNWIALFQSECVLNKRDCIIQYDLVYHKFKAKFVTQGAEGQMYHEDDLTSFDLPEDVKIVSVSLDPYRTYYNDTVSVSIRKDGWVTPHLVQLGIEENETDMRVHTLEVMPLTGAVNVYTENIGWEDLE